MWTEAFCGEKIRKVFLAPKPLEKVLIFLVENQGRVVGKPELIRAAWPDTAITDNSLAQAISAIRRVLSDVAQEVIRTVPRRDDVFASTVRRPPLYISSPALEPEPSSAPSSR